MGCASLRHFQRRCANWATACFGMEVVSDRHERAKRVIEEALELGQALGLTEADARDLVAYVFGRPAGEPSQEIAGVLNTTLVLADAIGVGADDALETELERIHRPDVFEKIRRKQVSKEVAGIGRAAGLPRAAAVMPIALLADEGGGP